MRTKKKGIILLLGLFTVLMTMLFGVGATSASAAELCTHNYEGTTHIATCTEQGYTEYVCSECGDTYKDDFVERSYVHGSSGRAYLYDAGLYHTLLCGLRLPVFGQLYSGEGTQLFRNGI